MAQCVKHLSSDRKQEAHPRPRPRAALRSCSSPTRPRCRSSPSSSDSGRTRPAGGRSSAEHTSQHAFNHVKCVALCDLGFLNSVSSENNAHGCRFPLVGGAAWWKQIYRVWAAQEEAAWCHICPHVTSGEPRHSNSRRTHTLLHKHTIIKMISLL